VLASRAVVILFSQEWIHAQKLLLAKYLSEEQAVGRNYAEKSFWQTEIIQLFIVSYRGKCKWGAE